MGEGFLLFYSAITVISLTYCVAHRNDQKKETHFMLN